MKCLNLHAVNDLRYEEKPSPKAAAGGVLIKIKACGICGSDVPRVLTKGTYNFPTIVGHEFAGEIVETGAGISKEVLGKRAAVFPLLPCFKCKMCAQREYASCADYNYFGSRCDGGFAEYLAAPLWNVAFAADNVDFEELAMAEPCAVALHALRRAGLKSGETVAVFGAGPIGLMLGQWVRIYGSTPVLIDVDERKAEFARGFGFQNAFAGKSADALEFIKEKTGGLGADICVEGAGFAPALENCLYAVKAFGRVVAMGNPSGDMPLSQKAYWEILRKQITVCGTWNSGYGGNDSDWAAVIKNINEDQGFIKAMWCGDQACEDKIKEETGAHSRCIPFISEKVSDKCVCCGKDAKHYVIWGRQY